MWPRRGLIATLGIMALAGCAGGDSVSGDSIGIAGGVNLWSDPFHDDDWIYYYDEGDEYFLAGLTDEEKDALKKGWDALPPEEKRQIRDRWNDLGDDERSRVRRSWGGLGTGAGSFDRGGFAGRGSFGGRGGGFGGRGGGGGRGR